MESQHGLAFYLDMNTVGHEDSPRTSDGSGVDWCLGRFGEEIVTLPDGGKLFLGSQGAGAPAAN